MFLTETSTTKTYPSDILTAEEAAQYLQVDTRVIRQMVADGELPAARIGKRGVIRIRRIDLEALFKKEAA